MSLCTGSFPGLALTYSNTEYAQTCPNQTAPEGGPPWCPSQTFHGEFLKASFIYSLCSNPSSWSPLHKLCPLTPCLPQMDIYSPSPSSWNNKPLRHPQATWLLSWKLDVVVQNRKMFTSPPHTPIHYWWLRIFALLFFTEKAKMVLPTHAPTRHSFAQSPNHPPTTFSTGFHRHSYGDLSSGHWLPGLESLGWSWDSSPLRGDLGGPAIHPDI